MCDKKQTPAESFYTRGRSASCDCIHLAQNLTRLPLHTIRSNSNFMIFFKSSPRVVEQLHRDFAKIDMPLKQFKDFCNSAWIQKHGFIVIDLCRDYESGAKYRSQLNFTN